MEESYLSETCPSSWWFTTLAGKVVCHSSTTFGCPSATFNTGNLPYNQVCGRILRYQLGGTDGFHEDTINNAYVRGVSVTHGNPRNHVWTFASGLAEIKNASFDRLCPCSLNSTNGARIPSFVGNNYFCGTVTYNGGTTLFPDDPLWDGQGCGPNNNCCTFNSPPWFNVRLSSPTTDDIEVRLCSYPQATTPLELHVVLMYVR